MTEKLDHLFTSSINLIRSLNNKFLCQGDENEVRFKFSTGKPAKNYYKFSEGSWDYFANEFCTDGVPVSAKQVLHSMNCWLDACCSE